MPIQKILIAPIKHQGSYIDSQLSLSQVYKSSSQIVGNSMRSESQNIDGYNTAEKRSRNIQGIDQSMLGNTTEKSRTKPALSNIKLQKITFEELFHNHKVPEREMKKMGMKLEKQTSKRKTTMKKDGHKNNLQMLTNLLKENTMKRVQLQMLKSSTSELPTNNIHRHPTIKKFEKMKADVAKLVNESQQSMLKF